MDYETATLDELKAEFIRLANVVVAASNERNTIHAVMDLRKAKVSATERVSRMTPLNRDALLKVLEEQAGVSKESA